MAVLRALLFRTLLSSVPKIRASQGISKTALFQDISGPHTNPVTRIQSHASEAG